MGEIWKGNYVGVTYILLLILMAQMVGTGMAVEQVPDSPYEDFEDETVNTGIDNGATSDIQTSVPWYSKHSSGYFLPDPNDSVSVVEARGGRGGGGGRIGSGFRVRSWRAGGGYYGRSGSGLLVSSFGWGLCIFVFGHVLLVW